VQLKDLKYPETIPGKHSTDCIQKRCKGQGSAKIQNLKAESWDAPLV